MINIITQALALKGKNLDAVLRAEFYKAKVGDVIRITDKDKKVKTLLLVRGNYQEPGENKQHIEYKVVNLDTGFYWRNGGKTLEEAFDTWFAGADGPKIKKLTVHHSADLILNN